jgi:hypothetical protein
MYSKVHTCMCKYLSHMIHIQIGLKQGCTLSPLLFNSALQYAIGKAEEHQKKTDIDWDTCFWFMVMLLHYWGNTHNYHENTEAALYMHKEVYLEINAENVR